MTGAAIAVPVGAVIQAGQRAGVRILLCIVIMPWVARAWLCSAARSPSCRRRRGPDGAAGGDRRGAARNRRQTRGPQAGRPFVRPDPGAAAFGHPRAIGVADRGHYARAWRARCSIRHPMARPKPRSIAASSRTGRRSRLPTYCARARVSRSSKATARATWASRFAVPTPETGLRIRNIVIFDDGFPVTQPDGLSRSDLIDPKAYGAIDVIRGPSSALYGNYATGGALNFRTRPGRTIDGVEYGVEGGSFGYLNNYLPPARRSAISNIRCLPAMRGVMGSSRIAGSIPRQ